MSFATQLKILRARHNVTQQELADYLNVTRPTIAGYETKGKEPDYSTLFLLSSYFRVSIDYLLTGKEFPSSINDRDSIKKERKKHDDIPMIQTQHDQLVIEIIQNMELMENTDLTQMLEYSKLLLLQPQYQKK